MDRQRRPREGVSGPGQIPEVSPDSSMISSNPAEIARKANLVFEKITGGPLKGSVDEVRGLIMGKIKKSLKDDVRPARILIDGFRDPQGFYPNNVMGDLSANQDSGIIAVNTFPVLCQNNHLKKVDGNWVVDDASYTVGGDPTMPLIQAAAMGMKTTLITVVGDDALGKEYVKRTREAGVNVIPVFVKGDTPIQFNFAHEGEFMGGIRLRKTPQLPNEAVVEMKRILDEQLITIPGDKIVLVGGASNSVDNQNLFGELLGIAREKGATAAYDTKDSHLGEPKEDWKWTDLPLTRNFLNADISKPNEGEAYILEQLVMGRRDLGKIGGEARDTGLQLKYWENPQRLVGIVREMRNVLRLSTKNPKASLGKFVFTLGAEGVVVVGEDLEYQKFEKPDPSIMDSLGLNIRSPQGGGNAFWGALLTGLDENKRPEDVIPDAQKVGLLSTYQLGNGCANPQHIRRLAG